MKNISLLILSLLLCFATVNSIAQTSVLAEGVELSPSGIGLSPAVEQAITSQFPKHDPRVSRCKGAFLRTKVIGTKKSYKLFATLALSEPFQQPVLKIDKQEYRTYTEVRLYEVLLRTFYPGEDENHGTYDYESVEGEVWEGETSKRTVLHGSTPLKSIQVTINGSQYMTDSHGIVQDSDNTLNLLEVFDDLGTRKVNFLVEVEGFEPITLPLTRTMPKRRTSDERSIDEEDKYEILLAYGLDFALSKREPEQNALQIKAIFPEDFAYAQAGVPFPLKIRVTNPSNRQTSCLLGRSFSRCPGLDGKLFYFGAIPPGKTMEFTRMVTVDKTEKANSANLEIRFSDSWGILTQKIPLSFTVIH